jgi:hypothetical protein
MATWEMAASALTPFGVLFLLAAALAADATAQSQAPDSSRFTGTPAEQLAAARARLDAFKWYRERRDFIPGGEVVLVEFSGKLQRWRVQIDKRGTPGTIETIWDGGRAARREIPFSTQWQCLPAVPDSAVNPPTTVRDGGTLLVDGKLARRLVEEFMADYGQPLHKVTHEVDIDATTGVPIRLISTEHPPGMPTKYVGTYYDLGVPIEIDFPCP